MPARNHVLLLSLEEGVFQTSSNLHSFSNLDCKWKKEKKTLPPAWQTTERNRNQNFGEKKPGQRLKVFSRTTVTLQVDSLFCFVQIPVC